MINNSPRKPELRCAILVAVLMAMCVSVRAQNPEQATTGSISGKVVNESGQPLVGALLYVRTAVSTSQGRSTTADIEGNFRVANLDPGVYTIAANAPAYTTDVPLAATYYRVGDTVRLQLVRGGVITGTVTNAMNEPVVGVRVRALKVRDANGQTPKMAAFAYNEQLTDDRGVYRIYGLAGGTYFVSAGGAGGFTSSSFIPYDSDVPTFSPSSTRDNAAEISVKAGEESTADIRYKGEPGYTISGSVLVTGNNSASISLTAVGSGLTGASAFQIPSTRGFAFNGLADGEYKLIAQEMTVQSSAASPLMALSEVKRVTIKGANVTGVELIPKPLASASGRIVLERIKIAECEGKRPPLLVETLVQAQRHEKDSEDDDPIYARVASSSAAVDENGAFVVRNMRPGRYRFELRFFARYWYLQSITMNTAGAKPQKIDASSNWTAVKSGEQLSTLTITLAEGAASIRGRLTLPEGTAAPAGTVVYLIPSEPDKANDVLRFFVTDVATDGTFTLNNLAPGKYLAFTQTNVDAAIATLARLREPEAAAARTKLRRTAEIQKNELELKPCQNLGDYQLK